MPRTQVLRLALFSLAVLLLAAARPRAAGGEPGYVHELGCNPLATSDDCLLPFPSLHYTRPDPSSPTGLRLAYFPEMFRGPDGALPIDPTLFNGADGVSPISTALVSFGVDVDPRYLSGSGEQEETVEPGAPIALIHAETGEAVPILTEMDHTNRDLAAYSGRHALVIRPLAPMRMGERYAVLLTSALRDVRKKRLESPAAFAALRDGTPTDDPVVEAMRPRYERLFEVAEAAGWKRGRLLLAWDFQVASEAFVLGPMRSMRRQTLALDAAALEYTIDEVQVDPNPNVAWLVEGSFRPPCFLDAKNELERGADGEIALQERRPSYPFTMIVPPAAKQRDRLPLVLFGHGLFGTGRRYLSGRTGERMIQPLAARYETVMVATDWIGLSGGDLGLILTQVVPDLSRIRLVTDRLAQSHVNNLALVELVLARLQSDPALARGRSGPLLDSERVYYYGISLGGIQGASQVALSPRISRAVLAVPGAGWANMIQRSTQFRPIESVIDERYPDPLTQTVFLSALQAFFDVSDPANLATLLRGATDKVVLLQEAIGDCQVPNIATDLLARAMGAAHLDVATDPVYGLATVHGPTHGPALTQIRVPDRLARFFPPDENTIPERDNGVHNAAVLQATAFEQMAHVLLTGEIVHPCRGGCDPD